MIISPTLTFDVRLLYDFLLTVFTSFYTTSSATVAFLLSPTTNVVVWFNDLISPIITAMVGEKITSALLGFVLPLAEMLIYAFSGGTGTIFGLIIGLGLNGLITLALMGLAFAWFVRLYELIPFM